MSETFTTSEPVPDDLVASHHPERPTDALLAEVRSRLAGRGDLQPGPPASWPRFGDISSVSAANQALERHLTRAADLLAEVDAAPILAPSPALSLPLLGRLWTLVRGQAHQLVLFYVHRQAARTSKAQHHLLAALQGLAVELASQREAIERLQGEGSETESQEDKE